MTTMCILASATGNDTIELEANNTHYTIEFEDTTLSEEKKNSISYALIGTNESEIMPANIWCDIFGHDYKYTTATVTEHKAKTYAPRCKLLTYDVTYCEDCDYTAQTLLGTSYINCCPEE